MDLIPKYIIKEAIERGGYGDLPFGTFCEAGFESHYILDPAFWQALGKARGWVEICNNPDHGFIEAMPGDVGRLGCPVCGFAEDYIVRSTKDNWKPFARSFYDLLLSSPSQEQIDRFWAELP